MKNKYSTFTVGDTLVRYDFPLEGAGAPQLSLLPKGLAAVPHRAVLPPDVEIKGLPDRWQPVQAFALDSLVQLKCRGDGEAAGFCQGRTMRNGPSTAALEFVSRRWRRGAGRPVW